MASHYGINLMTSVDEHKQAVLDMLSPGRYQKSGVRDILAIPVMDDPNMNEALEWGKVLAQQILDEEERQCKQKELEHQHRLEQKN
jgi:hypothetical protein